MRMKKIEFPEELRYLARLFPVPLYAVGGQVRNPLLSLPTSDRDICSALLPEDVIALCEREGIKYVPQGIAYGTVALHMNGWVFEHTTFRADSYGEGGAHKPQSVSFGGDIESDAKRRDFTVNALYVQIGDTDCSVLDPTGRGLADLQARVIRASSKDPSVILRDDALRILRMVRFACELGFSVDEDTFAAAKAHAAGISDISMERVHDELVKILLCDVRYPEAAFLAPAQAKDDEGLNPHEVPSLPCTHAGEDSPVYRGLVMLRKLGALDIILPELTSGRGVAQREQYHAYDVLGHCLHACALIGRGGDMPRDELLLLRVAALLHDIGKPEAKRRNKDVPGKHGHMYDHDVIGAQMAQKTLARLRFPTAFSQEVCRLIARHMYDLTGAAKDSTLRERFAEWGYEESLRLPCIREADVYGSGRTPLEEKVETAARMRRILASMREEGAPFSEAELRCTGADIMRWTGLSPSPRVGEIKSALLRHCARHPKDNRPERLAMLCRDMGLERE